MCLEGHLIYYILCLLLGNVVDIQTGKWVGKMSGLGAGLDSFYEYLLKVEIDFSLEITFEKLWLCCNISVKFNSDLDLCQLFCPLTPLRFFC